MQLPLSIEQPRPVNIVRLDVDRMATAVRAKHDRAPHPCASASRPRWRLERRRYQLPVEVTHVPRSPLFLLGIHHPEWLSWLGVPTFVSLWRLIGRYGQDLERLRLQAIEDWCLDSGGFTALEKWGGWPFGAERYARLLRRARVIGRLLWGAPQDWMCEAKMLRRTGLSVAEHQARTLRSVFDLRAMNHGVHVIPVLQGDTRDDYLRHAEEYERHGIALEQEPVVGVGSVCRRQGTAFTAALFAELRAMGLRTHGFGLKSGPAVAHVHSCDSMAWSSHARLKGIFMRDCLHGIPFSPGGRRVRHQNCANCARYALTWRAERLRSFAEKETSCSRQLYMSA